MKLSCCIFLAQINKPFLFLHIDGRPHFAKLSIGDIDQVKIAAYRA